MTITKEVLDERLGGVENADDLLGNQGLMKELKVRLMERMPGAELTEHLGYDRMRILATSRATAATARRARR